MPVTHSTDLFSLPFRSLSPLSLCLSPFPLSLWLCGMQKFTYSCCGRVSGGCERGVVTHHPGRYLRIETYNYTIKQVQ